MKRRTRILAALTAAATLSVVATACDATYYGGYNEANGGTYWKSKGICATAGGTPFARVCTYYVVPSNATVQACISSAAAAFPDTIAGVDDIYQLSGLCGASAWAGRSINYVW